jgi:hypothetical protein
MTLILHFHESGWWVHYQELGLSIPLRRPCNIASNSRRQTDLCCTEF